MARTTALRQPRPAATTMTSRAPHRVRIIAGPAWLLDCRWVVRTPLAAKLLTYCCHPGVGIVAAGQITCSESLHSVMAQPQPAARG